MELMYGLALLGRPGQWILHHEDLYLRYLDTRPQRDPDSDVPVCGFTFHGAPIDTEDGFIWAGSGPAPDFSDFTFWEDKNKDLDAKLKQIEAQLVQPRFTPEELQTLAVLETRPGNIYYAELEDKRSAMNHGKKNVVTSLLRLAHLGRPGQWILHNEALYHPALDTRPHTRVAGKGKTIVEVRDEHFTGDTRITSDEIFMDYMLLWAGEGTPPDFDDIEYWRDTAASLSAKEDQVKMGHVQPHFTEDELRTLEAFEADEEHAFAKILKAQREEPPVVVLTAEEAEARSERATARLRVALAIDNLWNVGLAGMWVLHCERLYLGKYDTWHRDQYDDRYEDDGCRDNILLDREWGLRYDVRFGRPDNLDDLAYWEAKCAELREKKEDIAAGRLTVHHFDAGDLMRIELLNRDIEMLKRDIIMDKFWDDHELPIDGAVGDSNTVRRKRRLAAWIDGIVQGPATECGSDNDNGDGDGDGNGNGNGNGNGKHGQSRQTSSNAAKRARSTDSDNDSDTASSSSSRRPAKRGKWLQPPPEPSPLVTLATPPCEPSNMAQTARTTPASTNEPAPQTEGQRG